MVLAFAADLLVVVHLSFILFVVLGGFLVLRWPGLAWAHVPAAVWGALIELSGQIACPLTPLEQALRRAAGEAGYEGGFIQHYLVPLVYPPGLTRDMQIAIGVSVVAINAFAYGTLMIRRWRAR